MKITILSNSDIQLYGPISLLKLDLEDAEFEIVKDSCNSGKIKLVNKTIMEVHDQVNDTLRSLGSILNML